VSDIPRPRTPDERVFVSGYRFDGIRIFLVKYALPAAGFFCLVAFPYFAYRFHTVFGEEMPDPIESRLALLVSALGFLGLSTAACFFFLARSLRVRFLETAVVLNDQGVIYRKAGKELEVPWEEVEDLKTRAAGRLQSATLITRRGKIPFDASFFNASGARPKISLGWGVEKMVFPNGWVQPMLVDQNELVGILRKKIEWLKKKRVV
jgi:hypothetical protein